METPLLQTKLYIPPIRPNLVSRPRLTERLTAGLHRKLTLVSAPAGFGKTTLISEWVQAMSSIDAIGGKTPPIAVAWLSLDKNDSNPTRFLSYLIAALRTVKADMAKGMLGLLQSPQPIPTEPILATIINEISDLSNHIILVLDDYHVLDSESVDESTSVDGVLTFLLEHLPPEMHLVIVAREDPRLPLVRLRVRGQMTELRATNLRFTLSEATEFLNQVMGLDLLADDIAGLERRTEGWIAGLHLAAVSMQGNKAPTEFIKSFTGSHRLVLDYLLEEVLKQQPESIQSFLLHTAVLDRMTGSL